MTRIKLDLGEPVKVAAMAQEDVLKIYERLPKSRKDVLNHLLVGYSTRQIADKLFHKNSDPIACVASHLREIYKSYGSFLKQADPESKRSHLIILFYSEVPSLVAQLKIDLGSPVYFGKQPKQFGDLPGEYRFGIHTVSKEDIPRLQVLGRQYFNTQDYLPTKLLVSWLEQDSNCFRQVKNKNQRTVGFFIILFPKLKTFEEFARGKLIEREIKDSMLLSYSEPQTHQENYAYISVVVGERDCKFTNIRIILCLAKYLDCLRCYRRIEKLYATAATDNGYDLLCSLGFHLHTPAAKRRDKEDFFEVDLSSITTNLFDYLVQSSHAYKRCSLSLDIVDDSWKPIK